MCVSNYSLREDQFSTEGSDSEAQGTIECVGDVRSNELDVSTDECIAGSSNTNPVCSSECCSISYDPVQVTDGAVIRKPQKRQGQKLRRFNPEWYRVYPWLVLCTTILKAFCSWCRYCQAKGLLTQKGEEHRLLKSWVKQESVT